jgi:hypothetical protein
MSIIGAGKREAGDIIDEAVRNSRPGYRPRQ